MNLTSVKGKKWIFKKFDDADIKKYSENLSISEIVAKLISIRKKNINNVDLYLNPTIKNLLPNPSLLKDMNVAIERVYKSILNHEPIGVFGDYDVDGASSTALLVKFFLSINQKIKTYIPDRMTEGYGPTTNSFNSLIKSGSKIIFTVDCGTSSFEAIEFAQKKSVDVIVLDHHQTNITLPKAHAVVNPNRIDDISDLNYLCAAGVTFVFLVGLNKKLRDSNWFKKNNITEPNILQFLDLVSLGTVCDVVPLVGLNRAIVKQGLKVIKKRSNLGLKTLYDICKIESQPTTYDLGFKLGPRINAGGRVGKSSHGAELLSSNDPERVYEIAMALDKSNSERKSIELMLYEKINVELRKHQNDPVLVLSGDNWHEGIIGIICSRLKERYNKPTILISTNKTLGKGSARSVIGFDIGSQIIKSTQLDIVEKGGGHKMAGGFTIKKDKIPLFREFLIKNYLKLMSNLSKSSNLYLDSIISPTALNENFYDDINSLAPFGSGNNEPKFVLENIKVIRSNWAADKHIKSLMSGLDGSVFKSIAFNAKDTPLEPYLNEKNKKKINIAGKIKLNEWLGKRNVEFEIEDISLS